MFMWSLMGLIGKDCPKQICQYFHTLRVCKRDAVIKKNYIIFFFQYLVSGCFSSTVTIHTHEPGCLRIILSFLQIMLSERTMLLCYSIFPSSLQQDSKCYLPRSEYINMFWNPLGPFRRRNMARSRIWGSCLRNRDLQKNLIEMRCHE